MNTFRILTMSFLAVAVTACSPKDTVKLKGLDIGTSQVNSTTYVNMEAIVTMGSLRFPNIEVPVINPNNMHSLGQMALQSLDDGTNRISVSLDYQEVTQLNPGLGQNLPNGRELPIRLSSGNGSMIGIPALEQSRIYIGGDLQKEMIMGVAVAVPAFDSAMSQVPIPLNLFFNYPFSTEVSGMAGIFSGPTKGQNGIAVFAKKVMTGPQFFAGTNSSTSQAEAVGDDLKHLNTVTLIRLDRLSRKHATLRVK